VSDHVTTAVIRYHTLLSCLGKVFTGVLCNRIDQWVKENDRVSDAQFGFKKGYSTIDAMFILHNLIIKYANDKKNCFVLLLIKKNV
jgi:hypothetical protein